MSQNHLSVFFSTSLAWSAGLQDLQRFPSKTFEKNIYVAENLTKLTGLLKSSKQRKKKEMAFKVL